MASEIQLMGPVGVYLLPEGGSEVLIGQTDGVALIDIAMIDSTETVPTDAEPLGAEFIQLGSQAVVSITFQEFDRAQMARAMQRLAISSDSVVYQTEGKAAEVGLGLVADKPTAADGLRLKGSRKTLEFPRFIRDGRVDAAFANIGHKAQRATAAFLALPNASQVVYTYGDT